MTNKIATNKTIGTYLECRIKQKFPNVRQFCKAYVANSGIEVNDDEIRKMQNRFSQILKGKKGIQIQDLLYLSDLLDVSCEEILTGGKVYKPVAGRMTNYVIAHSTDKNLWDKYINDEHRQFLNYDEYGKSVIDYALESKNYQFIKYLLDNKYIWFVDLSEWRDFGYSYGAGTSIKARKIGYIDCDTPQEIQMQDRLRTSTIALAIENQDYAVLDTLLARQVPAMQLANINGFPSVDYRKEKNKDLISAVASADEKIIDYYSHEFTTECIGKKTHTFIYPYLENVIELLLKNGRNDMAELCIRRAIKHNQKALDDLNKLIQDACEFYEKDNQYRTPDLKEYAKKIALDRFTFDKDNDMVSFAHYPSKGQTVGLVTNVVRVNARSSNALLNELIDELNSCYHKIESLNKEQKSV